MKKFNLIGRLKNSYKRYHLKRELTKAQKIVKEFDEIEDKNHPLRVFVGIAAMQNLDKKERALKAFEESLNTNQASKATGK